MTITLHPKNPYVGPRPFQSGEKLYGRDQEIMDLLDLLIAERIVLLYSPSGAGKTSLIQAGLSPELEAEEFQVLPVMRVSLEPPQEELIERPSGFNRYILSLLLSLEEGLPEEQQALIAELAGMTLAEYLERRKPTPDSSQEGNAPTPNPSQEGNTPPYPPQGGNAPSPNPSHQGRGTDNPSHQGRETDPGSEQDSPPLVGGDGGGRRIVLIFDQFEEILTIDPTDREVKAEFFAQVGAALRHPDRWALFSMREEFPAGLDPYRRYVPTRLSTTFRLELLDREAALQAIREPARQAGIPFTGKAADELIDDLSRVRVQQPNGVIIERPGAFAEPVQLQVVCQRLWEKLPDGITEIREADIQEARDVDTALAGYYADRVKVIAQETGIRERAIREWFLHHLITDQGIRGQVIRSPEQTQGLDNQAIEWLVDAHLVRAENRRGLTWYELAHDRLIEPIQLDNFDWLQEHLSMLQREAALWELQDRAEGLLLRDEALEEAERWADEHQDELTSTEQEFLEACREFQARTRRERRNNFLIRGLAVVATIIMFVALSFYVKSEARRKESEQLSFGSIAQNLINEAAHQNRNDLRILLIRQAYLFNQRGRGNILAHVDNMLRTELASPYFSRALRVSEEVMSVALSPDGQFLAFGGGDGRVQLFNLHEPTSSFVMLRGHKGPVCSIAFSPDGQRLASGGWDKKVRLWDLQTPDTDPIVLNGHEKAVFSVAFSPNGQTLASGSWDKAVRLWDLQNLQAEPRILRGHEKGVNSVAFSPDGQTLASGSSDGTIRLWDVHNPDVNYRVLPSKEQKRPPMPQSRQRPGERPGSPPRGQKPSSPQLQPNQPPGLSPEVSSDHLAGVNSVAFSPDGQALASGHSDNIVQIWNVQNLNRPLVKLEGHLEEILAVAFSPDGQTLASGAWDKTVRLWDLQNPHTDPTVLRGHDDVVFAVVFSPDGRSLVSGSGDKMVRLWDLKPSESTVLSLRPPQPEVLPDDPGLQEQNTSGSFRPPEEQPPTSDSEDRTRRPEGFAPSDSPSLHAALRAIKSVIFSQDSQTLLSVNEDGIGQLWDLGKPNTISTILDKHRGKATAVAFSPDRKIVAIGGDDGGVRLWSLGRSDTSPVLLRGHTGSVSALAFSSDETTLASGGEDKTIRIWDLQNPAANPIVLRGHKEGIRTITFNSEKEILASGGEDNVVRLWNVRFPEYPPHVLPSHEGSVISLVFSPDGTTLASGSEDGETRLWNLRNLRTDLAWLIQFGVNFTALRWHNDSVSSLAFSSDGMTLASGSQDTIYLWDLRNLEANPIILGESMGSPQSPPQASSLNQGKATRISGENREQTDRATQSPPPEAIPKEQRPLVQALAFSPDGKKLASGSQDGTIMIWTRTEALIEEVCRQVWRNLTLDEWRQFIGKGIPYERICTDLPPARQ